MNTTDKPEKPDATGEKLVQSIRKTKASPATNTRRRTTKSKAAVSSRPSKAEAKVAAEPKKSIDMSDPYQGAKRVWPD